MEFEWNGLTWCVDSLESRISTVPVYERFGQFPTGHKYVQTPDTCAFCAGSKPSSVSYTIHALRPGAKLEMTLCGECASVTISGAALALNGERHTEIQSR